MQHEADGQIDRLVRNERRGIGLALIVVLVLAATLVFGSDTRRALLAAMAVGIVTGVTWLGRRRPRGPRSEAQERHQAVMHDELRQVAIAHAYKWAFFTLLGALAIFCLLSVIVAITLPAQMLAALTVALGVTAFLAIFLPDSPHHASNVASR